MCRCDSLDPALAWTGVKDSGRGVSLSQFGWYSDSNAKPDTDIGETKVLISSHEPNPST